MLPAYLPAVATWGAAQYDDLPADVPSTCGCPAVANALRCEGLSPQWLWATMLWRMALVLEVLGGRPMTGRSHGGSISERRSADCVWNFSCPRFPKEANSDSAGPVSAGAASCVSSAPIQRAEHMHGRLTQADSAEEHASGRATRTTRPGPSDLACSPTLGPISGRGRC